MAETTDPPDQTLKRIHAQVSEDDLVKDEVHKGASVAIKRPKLEHVPSSPPVNDNIEPIQKAPRAQATEMLVDSNVPLPSCGSPPCCPPAPPSLTTVRPTTLGTSRADQSL
jgi:hypothetical protein